MAGPATVTLAVKAAVAAASDPRTRKIIVGIIAAVLSPVILITVFIVTLAAGVSAHNAAALDLYFSGGVVPSRLPDDYRLRVTGMRESFDSLENALGEIGDECAWEDGEPDIRLIRAVFYSLFSGSDYPQTHSSRAFVDCFVRYEPSTDIVESGNSAKQKDNYTAAFPLSSMPEIYSNIDRLLGRAVTTEEKSNASEVYYRLLYGGSIPTYGAEFDIWSDGLPLSDAPFIGADGFCSPLGKNWPVMVTSEFGYRKDPITGLNSGHTGIDISAPKGTPIRAALDGTVQLVRHSSTGYGYHLAIDHGGGFVTLYAHCSRILVTEGQSVDSGDVIAQVGRTGRSTGYHLHFEVKIRGKKQNPRLYLPH